MSIYNSNVKQTLGVGTVPNDGTGDTLRTIFIKTNNNFSDLYTFLGNGTHLGNISQANFGNINVGNIALTGNLTSGSISSAVIFPPTGVVASTYGGQATVPVYTVNASGRLTNASNVSISIPSSAINTDIVLGSQTSGNYIANIIPGNGLTGSSFGTEGATPTIALANTGVTAGHYGNTTHYAGFQVDSYGRIVSANTIATIGAESANNVLFVSKSGDDSNSGTSLSKAKLTIAAAVTVANSLQASNPSGTTVILLKAGDYTEVNPIALSAGVSIVGDNLRAVTVRPSNTTQDIFHVRNRCYITGITFRDHLTPAAAVAFPPSGAGAIVTSPYVQNCSSITTTGCGMRIDGNLASGLKSMVLDSYTQFNQGGLGIHIINQGYAQLVSIFTICCTAGVKCESGGTCSISNSNNSFGTYGLWADGASSTLYSGTVVSNTRKTITISGLSQRPAVNDALLVSGQTQYLLVRSATALSSGTSTIDFDEILEFSPTPGASVDFRQISLISASGQTFEYIGTGTSILTATPRLGGIPNQANETHETNGGRVNYTSTDQFGDFRIGDGLVIKEEAGVIEGITFDRSLFAVLTPYILALEG